jgi:hypothetical protein
LAASPQHLQVSGNGGCAALITRSFGRLLIISSEYPASYDEHDVQHEANGGGGEANLGEQRQAIPCRDVERLKHVDHGSSLSFASNLEKSRPVAAECQGSYVMSMAGDYAMSMPCDSLPPRSRRQQLAGRMIDE